MSTPDHLQAHTPLGKATVYPDRYNPKLLVPIERRLNRQAIGIGETLPFHGYDLWNAYELSWLNKKGKPIAAIGQFIIPCTSTYLIESKSFKLYLNSFNNEQLANPEEVMTTITKDLSQQVGTTVTVQLQPLTEPMGTTLTPAQGSCLDDLDIMTDCYEVNPDFLSTQAGQVNETLHSHLLKSNCPVTNQPDWGTVHISYRGAQIDHAGLLKYIISYRNHNDFHEACVERIFTEIQQHCQPEQLTVSANYTRRGGLDINPFRCSEPVQSFSNGRLIRQ